MWAEIARGAPAANFVCTVPRQPVKQDDDATLRRAMAALEADTQVCPSCLMSGCRLFAGISLIVIRHCCAVEQ